jgi:hypothetical protein
MSETRPTGGELDDAAQLLASARARLEAAAAELSVDGALRLSERERTAASAMLSALVAEIEDELRSNIARQLEATPHEAARAALTSASLSIARPILDGHDSLIHPDLVSILMRRVEEQRLSRFVTERPLLIDLAGDSDPAVAAEATAVLIAQSRRSDSFQEPLVALADLPAEVEHALVWTLAAALRTYLVARQGVAPASADEAVTSAAAAALARHDEGSGVDAASRRLAGRLNAAGRLDDELVVRSATEGTFPLFLAALEQRTRLDPAAIWEILLRREGPGAALLLRAAGLGRAAAARVLLHLAQREEAAAAQLDLFDALSAEEASARLRLWTFDPAYRAAIVRLAS